MTVPAHAKKKPSTHRALKVLLVLVAFILVAGVVAQYSFRSKPVQSAVHPLRYESIIADCSLRHQLNPYWVCAMIERESSWDPEAVSYAGAVGLMQIQPETAYDLVNWNLVDGKIYSPENLTDPATNIEFGCAYLRYLVERYHEMQPAIAAYNAGPGNVDRWLAENSDVKENMDFAETRTYLVRVESSKALYEELYPDAFPEYAGEGQQEPEYAGEG